MNSSIFPSLVERPPVVESSEITDDRRNGALLADVATLDGKLPGKFRPSILIGTTLMGRGFFI